MTDPHERSVSLPIALNADVGLGAGLSINELDTPAVLIDLDVVDANILAMQRHADREGFHLRPHAKTHKSSFIAGRQIAAGAVGITVSSVSEAQAMRNAGIEKLTLAYPIVGAIKLARLRRLLAGGPVTLVSDSVSVTRGYAALAESLGRPIDVLVELDTGMHRVGADPREVVNLVKDLVSYRFLKFVGILTHAGHAHDVIDRVGVAAVARDEARIMGAAREELEASGFPVAVVSAGSTLTVAHLLASDGVTEIRPGTYVYNDLRTLACWSCEPSSIAATMWTTVVSSSGQRVVVDAGNKTLTPTQDQFFGFGYPLSHPEVGFSRLSEEHGVLDWSDGTTAPVVGDRLQLLPIHICAWIDLQPEVYAVRQGLVVARIPVEGMRHSL
jgi:D-serine deaminase-like pyridoxal phosphate-dependent protein